MDALLREESDISFLRISWTFGEIIGVFPSHQADNPIILSDQPGGLGGCKQRNVLGPSGSDFQDTAVRPYDRRPYDRNGDGSICLKTLWGDSLNPQARWYGIELYLPAENTANATNK